MLVDAQKAKEKLAKVCEDWGTAKVIKWQDSELADDAKATAWDALQCAAAIRNADLSDCAGNLVCCQKFDTCNERCWPLICSLREQIAKLQQKICHHGWRGTVPDEGERIVTPCPACGARSLFIGAGGHLTCARVPSDFGNGCESPSVEETVNALKAQVAELKKALSEESRPFETRRRQGGEMTENLPAINWKDELQGAAMLLKSGLVPRDVKSPETALFIVLAGRDLGLSPVQSLRSIRPIQGKLECSADLQLGLFHRGGGKSRWVKLDHTGAELELSASWLTQPHVSKFGVEDAKRADLMSNANYRKYPLAMFRSRAITQGLKDIGFLAGAGVYAPGELGGVVVIDDQGEVLPVVVDDQSGLAGAVESLEDSERDELANVAQTITDAINGKDMESAMNYWRAHDNDQKTAIWAMLDKPIRKALKEADAATRTATPAPVLAAEDSDRATESSGAHVAAAPTIAEVSKLIMTGKLDEAADLARGFPEKDRQVLEQQIAARRKA